MKAQLIRDMEAANRQEYPDGIIPNGTVIDHPDCFKLVQFGVAIPADDECRAKANCTEGQMQAAQAAYEKVERGIHPEDYEAFDQGLMIGYDENGRWLPGPNAEQEDEERDADADWFDAMFTTNTCEK